jgi:hypothetical protein
MQQIPGYEQVVGIFTKSLDIITIVEHCSAVTGCINKNKPIQGSVTLYVLYIDIWNYSG